MAKLHDQRQSDETHMNTTDDKESALVRASSTALARSGSRALAHRGLYDLEVAEQKSKAEDSNPEDQGPLEREYYVIQASTGWDAVEDSDVGWEPESHPDGTTWLRVPESLLGKIFGPFFTMSEAQQSAERKRRGQHNQAATLPLIASHLWTGHDDVAHGFPPGCSFCGESDPSQYGQPCPKRSSYTWYDVLGVSEIADQSQINDSYHRLSKEWDLKRLRYRDDIRFDGAGCDNSFSETQLKWFNAAHAVLGDPAKRRQYDAELERERRGI